MKKILIIASLLLANLFGYSQILEHNYAIQKNLRNEQPEMLKSNIIQNSEFVRDTIGDGLFISARNHVFVISDSDVTPQLTNLYKALDYKAKEKKEKNLITARIKKFETDSINAVIKSIKDSISKKLADYNIKGSAVRDTIDTLLKMNNEIELSILQILESIRLYQSKLDSTKVISSRGELTDSVVYLLSNLTLLNNNREYWESFERSARQQIIRSVAKLNNNDFSQIEVIDDLENDIKGHRGELSKLKTIIRHNDSTWNHFSAKYIISKTAKPVEVSALPFFSTIPGVKDINGSINVIGSSVINDTGSYIEFGLFTGILKSSDSSNIYNVFISEVSNYAFYFKWNYGFESVAKKSTKKIALNSEIFYANKPISKDSAIGIRNNFNSSFFQGKFGLGFLIYKNLLSGYFNANALSVVTNKQLFDQRYSPGTDIIGYADFGFKMLLSTSLKIPDGLKLYIDLNFLINTDDLKKFNPGSNDILIPNFRVGLKADLGKI